MIAMGATNTELRRMADLAAEGKQEEAGAMLSEIGRRQEEAFKREIREEMRAAISAVSASYRRRLIPMAMTAGLLAGTAAAGCLAVGLWFFADFVPTVPQAVAATFGCAAFGAFAGWSKAK